MHVPCPTGQDAASAAKAAPREARESAANATGACPAGGAPQWSYLSSTAYSRFVKGVAARLRLVNGDTVLNVADPNPNPSPIPNPNPN